jgi:DNA-directed RNA polymerase
MNAHCGSSLIRFWALVCYFWEDMLTAERMTQQEYFYTAMNLEWRGRVYSVPSFNFQREDRVRALFLFARGEPIGEEGVYWLKVHVANCGDFNGIKKRPFGERVKWVDDNLELIRSMAEIPVSMFKRWVEQTAKHPEHKWQGPDKPFLFLSACLELSAALRAGPSYVSHLPVSFDGSCSGLQHLCAMTRAPEGSSVNLTPQEVPADIYQTVADRVKQRIEGDLKSQDKQRRELAQMCLKYGITRKIVKRNVMTYSYGSNAYGMTEQLREDLMQPLSKEVALGKRNIRSGADFGRATIWPARPTLRLKKLYMAPPRQRPSCKSWLVLCRTKASLCGGKHLLGFH